MSLRVALQKKKKKKKKRERERKKRRAIAFYVETLAYNFHRRLKIRKKTNHAKSPSEGRKDRGGEMGVVEPGLTCALLFTSN